jgi:hypothetical protein
MLQLKAVRIAALAVLVLSGAAFAAEPTPRYQVIAGEPNIKVDTLTGKTWRLVRVTDGQGRFLGMEWDPIDEINITAPKVSSKPPFDPNKPYEVIN